MTEVSACHFLLLQSLEPQNGMADPGCICFLFFFLLVFLWMTTVWNGYALTWMQDCNTLFFFFAFHSHTELLRLDMKAVRISQVKL